MNWLEVIGIVSVCYTTYLISSILYRLFLRGLSLNKYKKGRSSWAVVTGASDGIGMGFVRVLAKNGFNVLLISRNEEKLKKCIGELAAEFKSVNFDYCVSDANNTKSIQSVLDSIKGKDVAILVNNVGINQGEADRLENVQTDILERVVTINCMYPLLLTKVLVPILRGRKHPSAIVNISSVSAQIQTPFHSTYSAAKAFTRFFSLSLSGELFDVPIDVLSVEPGYVATNLTKMKRNALVCTAEECAMGALKQLGLVEAIPHWKHYVMLSFLRLLVQSIAPSSLQPFIIGHIMKTLAFKRYAKKEL